MLDIAKRILIVLFTSGAVAALIYFALDHWQRIAASRQARSALKLVFILSTLVSAGYQFYYADLELRRAADDRSQAAEDRKQAAKDRKAAAEAATQSQAKIDQLTRDINQKDADYQEKLRQARLAFLKEQSEAEMRAIGSEFSDFAESFSTNKQERSAKLVKLKTDLKTARDEAERAVRDKVDTDHCDFTAQVYPSMYFAIHFIQDSVRAYATRIGESIKIDTVDLTDDLYAHPIAARITFPSGAIWLLSGHAADNELVAWFHVTFMDSDSHVTGDLYTAVNPGRHIISFAYTAIPPVPDPSTINGDFPIADYETPIKRAFREIIRIQLANAVTQ